MIRRYRYMTRNGHPPNQGVPPGVPRAATEQQQTPGSTAPQPTNMAAGGPAQMPPPPQPHPTPPPAPAQPAAAPSFLPPPPLGYCWLPAVGCYPAPSNTPPPPPPYQAGGADSVGGAAGGCQPNWLGTSPSPVYGAAPPAPGVMGGQAGTLPPGARVRGEIPVFPNRNSGYIFGQKQCAFSIIEGRVKPWTEPGCEVQFINVGADCRMTIKEFIEQVGAPGRAPARSSGDDVGICEVIERGDGVWQKGSQFKMSDPVAKLSQTLADVGWDELRGEAGMGKPVWLVILP